MGDVGSAAASGSPDPRDPAAAEDAAAHTGSASVDEAAGGDRPSSPARTASTTGGRPDQPPPAASPERPARPVRPAGEVEKPARPVRPAGAAAAGPRAGAATRAAGRAAAAEPPAPPGLALIDEAIKKAAVAWVTVPGRQAIPLWCLPQEDADRSVPRGRLYVVSGPGEQPAPGLDRAGTATVTLRGDHGGRIVTWTADVRRVLPDTEEWTTVAPLLAGKRLNAPGPAEALVARWAAECTVHCLVPTGEPVEAGATLPDAAQAEPPRESVAVRAVRRPFRLHRVRRARG